MLSLVLSRRNNLSSQIALMNYQIIDEKNKDKDKDKDKNKNKNKDKDKDKDKDKNKNKNKNKNKDKKEINEKEFKWSTIFCSAK